MKSYAAVYVEAASALECIGGFCIGLQCLYSRYSPINNIHINNMFPTDPSVWPKPTVTRGVPSQVLDKILLHFITELVLGFNMTHNPFWDFLIDVTILPSGFFNWGFFEFLKMNF